jgi:hypothetical protein
VEVLCCALKHKNDFTHVFVTVDKNIISNFVFYVFFIFLCLFSNRFAKRMWTVTKHDSLFWKLENYFQNRLPSSYNVLTFGWFNMVGLKGICLPLRIHSYKGKDCISLFHLSSLLSSSFPSKHRVMRVFYANKIYKKMWLNKREMICFLLWSFSHHYKKFDH